MILEEARRTALDRRVTEMLKVRLDYEPDLKDLEANFSPRRTRWQVGNRKRGQANSEIINGAPLYAVTVMKSGMMSGHTSPSRPWFKLITPDPGMMEAPGVREWLYTVETRMREVFARSNVYNALPSCYGDLGSFGTAAMGLYEDTRDTIRCFPYLMGSYAISNGPRLSVDSFARKWRTTSGNLVDEFGLDNVSPKIANAYKTKKFDDPVDVCHILQPNRGRKLGMADNRNMPVESVYWEHDWPGNRALRVGGYQEFPVMVPRWETAGLDAWGDAPALTALGDAKQLQFEELVLAQLQELTRRPAHVLDPALKNKTHLGPGGKNYVSLSAGNPGAKPIYVPDPNAVKNTQETIAKLEERINRYMFVDIFLMLAQSDLRQITAREVEERHGEKLLMLGPVLERLADELLDPLIARTFAIMLRAGMIPEWPAALDGMPVKVEYISILAQAQKAVATNAIEAVAAFAGSFAQVSPEALDKLDIDQAIDEYSQLRGAPPTIIRSDDAVAARRRQRAEQQAAMAQAAMAKEAAAAANQLGNTPMGTGSALDKLVA